MPHQGSVRDRAVVCAGRVVLAHAEAVDGQDQNVANQRRLLHKGQILRVVEDGLVLLQLLKDNVRPGSRPRRVHDLEALGMQLVDGHAVDVGQVLHRPQHAVDHLLEDGVPRGRGNRPLAELEPVGDVGPRHAVSSVELDAHDQTDLVAELVRDPGVHRLERDGVGVGVDAALGVEQQVAQEVRLHAHVGQVVVDLGDPGVVAEAARDELIAALVADQGAIQQETGLRLAQLQDEIEERGISVKVRRRRTIGSQGSWRSTKPCSPAA